MSLDHVRINELLKSHLGAEYHARAGVEIHNTDASTSKTIKVMAVCALKLDVISVPRANRIDIQEPWTMIGGMEWGNTERSGVFKVLNTHKLLVTRAFDNENELQRLLTEFIPTGEHAAMIQKELDLTIRRDKVLSDAADFATERITAVVDSCPFIANAVAAIVAQIRSTHVVITNLDGERSQAPVEAFLPTADIRRIVARVAQDQLHAKLARLLAD